MPTKQPTAEAALKAIANAGTTNVRVAVQIYCLNGWDTKDLKDKFTRFCVHVRMNKVGVGPIYNEQFYNEKLDVTWLRSVFLQVKKAVAAAEAPAQEDDYEWAFG